LRTPKRCSPQELLWPHFAHLDDHIRRFVQPPRRLADRLGVGRLVQTVTLLFVDTKKREQPLDANIRFDLRGRGEPLTIKDFETKPLLCFMMTETEREEVED